MSPHERSRLISGWVTTVALLIFAMLFFGAVINESKSIFDASLQINDATGGHDTFTSDPT